MSFILDALRKSEQERQRKQGPGIAAAPMQTNRATRPTWVILVVLLVSINLSLLLLLWINGSPMSFFGSASQEAGVEVTAPAPATTAPVRINRPLSAEITAAEAPRTDTASQQAAPAATTQPLQSAKKPASKATANIPPVSNLPTLMELMLAGSISLKPQHLDIHVYSEQPAERFVFVNMSKYREGDTLSDGPVVDAITESGVVLTYQGRKFILTRE